MSKTIRYIGATDPYLELPITGKQSVWKKNQQEQRSDTEADLLVASGQFIEIPTAAAAVVVSSAIPVDGDGRPDGTVYIQTA